jgi:AraC family transcriptional regulator
MKRGLVYLRPARLTYVRAIGSYETAIPQAWDRLLNWVEKNGLNSAVGRGYGLARDNPLRVEPAKCRYDACIQVSPLFEERALRELGLVTLPPGPYARMRHAGSYEAISSCVATLHGKFSAPAELRLDDRRPIVTIYLDDPRRFDPADLRADICTPVTAAMARPKTEISQAAA